MPKSTQDTTTPASTTATATPRPSRQADGLACDECRARKLRCDRVRPTCGTCANLGVTCTPNTTRQPRGPRKGHMKALQSRIAALERQLSTQATSGRSEPTSPSANPDGSITSPTSHGPQRQISEAPSPGDEMLEFIHVADTTPERDDTVVAEINPENNSNNDNNDINDLHHDNHGDKSPPRPTIPGFNLDFAFPPGPPDLSSAGLLSQDAANNNPMDLLQDMATFTTLHSHFDSISSTVVPSNPSTIGDGFLGSKSLSDTGYVAVPAAIPARLGFATEFHMSDLMKADLNHLYFDRVHLFVPIFNRRRHFARAARPAEATAPFVCLQHAMWTLASGFASQFKDIQKGLYAHTRMLLEEWELSILPGNMESPPIELAQAWIFIAIYEIMQVHYERGWLSAGRCFRLMQLMKLHEIDAPDGAAAASSQLNLPPVEIEERRRTFWMAYTLDRFLNLVNYTPLTLNEQVRDRLPAASSSKFLSEVLAAGPESALQQHAMSPFGVCIVLATISGRCLSHLQQSSVEKVNGTMPQDFLTRHQWLENALANKMKSLFPECSHGDDDHVDDHRMSDESAWCHGLRPMLLFTNMMAQATTILLAKVMQSVVWNYDEFVNGYEQRAVEAAHELWRLSKKLGEYGYFKVHPYTPVPLLFCAEFALARKQRDTALERLYNSVTSSLRDLCVVNILADTCLSKVNAAALSSENMDVDTVGVKSVL
ncbi:hypothetical protein QBC42DRAFT_295095 [Cladorrhinum samala]|uniref:Zn(2)-C6 fungal-type domain-containing protein n=1 Tax=Cladorrhinum samala TaxID=585594 RepID=A0AAV9HU62_9PEZI|nr:hypothetical protein QBC42DRAFT_295095 [Cladorrhinum samala]